MLPQGSSYCKSPFYSCRFKLLLPFCFIMYTVLVHCCFFAGREGQINGSHCLLCRGQRIQPDPGRFQQRILKMWQIHRKANTFLSVSVCFSSLQPLQTLWNMCFLYGEASKPSGESLTRYDTYVPHVHSHKLSSAHREDCYVMKLFVTVFFLPPAV